MSSDRKLGIFAGKGDLPRLLTEACRSAQRPYCIVAFENNTPSDTVAGHEHLWTRFGAVGSTLDELRARGVGTLVMAGRLERPSLSSLKPDAKGAKLLKKLGAGLFAGDDRMLKIITGFLEKEGFEIVGADEILGDALTTKGVLGRHAPTVLDKRDIKRGFEVAKTIGEQDVGQAVIVQAGHVLGVEAIEGTDALIARCAALRQDDPAKGVLVKVCKPRQERRADLPSIGVKTIEALQQAGFAGVALEAERSLIIDRSAVVQAADNAKLFLFGIGE